MRAVLGFSILVVVALWAPRAGAQESHRFNAKALAAKYALPVFHQRAKVVNDEIVESTDDVTHQKTGIYVVRAKAEKAVAFYTKALGEPKDESTDTGVKKWIFKAADPRDSLTRHHVIVSYDKHSKQVQIMLWMRTYESAADANF